MIREDTREFGFAKEAHKAKFSDIARNQKRRVRLDLLIFPEGCVCTGQLESPIPFDGEKVENQPCDKSGEMEDNGKTHTHALSEGAVHVEKPRPDEGV